MAIPRLPRAGRGAWRGLCRLSLIATVLAGTSACAATPSSGSAVPEEHANTRPSTVTVLAAVSLSVAMDEVARAFEVGRPGLRVATSYAGSQALAAQLLDGAAADVFVSANAAQLARLTAAALVTATVPVASNQLVLLLPADNPAGIRSVADLAQPGVRVVLAAPEVPAGDYARQALARLGLGAAVALNVVSEEVDVTGVVGKVATGEADAGLAYRTDLTPALASRLMALDLPPAADVRVRYEAAVLVPAPQPRLAADFLAFLTAAAGQAILARHGFGAP